MDELVELLKQIQELAGVGIDALKQAGGGGEGEKPEPGPEGAPAGPPAEEPPAK